MPGGSSKATGWLSRSDSARPHATSSAIVTAESTRCGMRIMSSRPGEISPISRCSGASRPPCPRQVTSSSAGSRYSSESDTRAFRLVPRPEFCISTMGVRPASQAPAAMPTATSSRTAGT